MNSAQNGMRVGMRITEWTTLNTHMVGTCESLYSANTSLGVPTIIMDLAMISVTPSLNLYTSTYIISMRQTLLLLDSMPGATDQNLDVQLGQEACLDVQLGQEAWAAVTHLPSLLAVLMTAESTSQK